MKNTDISDEQVIISQINASAQDMSRWLKSFGILNIIIGIPSLLFLVGAINIWLGWTLYQAGKAAGAGSAEKVNRMMGKMKTYFAVMTILTSIGIVVSILGFAVMGTALFNLFSSMPQ